MTTKTSPSESSAVFTISLKKGAKPRLQSWQFDEKGKDLTSLELSKRLSDWTAQGYNPISFLIGGARGHGVAVKERADFVLSIGKMTWPHMLVRAMLAEKLYRAWSIDAGHPYHRA